MYSKNLSNSAMSTRREIQESTNVCSYSAKTLLLLLYIPIQPFLYLTKNII